MFLVSAFILFGIMSCSLAKDSCFNKIDYDFFLLQNLINEVEQKVKFLKDNVKAGGNETCANTTCSNTTTCADGWISYKGWCYLFDNDQGRFFSDAESFCAQFGATLVHVNDIKENEFIIGMLKHFNKKDWWVGLADEKTEGDWRWVDTNTRADFTAWDSSQPKGGRDFNCAEYYYRTSFSWHDTYCSKKKNHPICQKRLQ